MALSKAIAAKVSAYESGWVDPEEFAEFADKGLIYRQAHHLQPNRALGLFVIGSGDKALPIDMLTDLKYAADLAIVLTCDAVNKRILGVLRIIENTRMLAEGEHIFAIDVVGDVGEDASTGETKYYCIPFGSTEALADAYIRGTLQDTVRKYEKIAVTLTQVDDFTPTAKRYKVSD
ncbi:hypothetical protein ES707_06309 [subsurface metagenome]